MHISEVKTGLLYYLIGSHRMSVVLLEQNGAMRTFPLPQYCEVFPRVDALQDALAGPYSSEVKEDALKAFSSDWGKTLLPPVSALLENDVLVIVPSAELYGLPFHTIQVGADRQPLGALVGISYCSSGMLFEMCVSRNAARHADLSTWDFSTQNAPIAGAAPNAPQRCQGISADVLHDQDAKYRELTEEFLSFFPDKEFAEFTPRFLLKDPKFDVVCVICHGHFDETDPENCGLLLNNHAGMVVERSIMVGSGASFNFRDLPLRSLPMEVVPRSDSAAELFTINEMKIGVESRAELVALLGCSTATGSLGAIHEPGTLAEQWLRAGAASVLANLWEIDIEFLRQWIRIFLTNWVEKRQPKAIAWRETIREILRENTDRSSYEWGCISILGDWL